VAARGLTWSGEGELVLDWSAYARVALAARGSGRRLPGDAVAHFGETVRQGTLHVCAPFRMEARYSARDAEALTRVDRTLDGFPQARGDASTFELALSAQSDLAETPGVSHRVKPVDLLLAAIAHRNRLGVLHYDRDYDVLAAHTRLEFTSVWIAEPGSVD
jgi:predicted nucleic acid-binding protein